MWEAQKAREMPGYKEPPCVSVLRHQGPVFTGIPLFHWGCWEYWPCVAPWKSDLCAVTLGTRLSILLKNWGLTCSSSLVPQHFFRPNSEKPMFCRKKRQARCHLFMTTLSMQPQSTNLPPWPWTHRAPPRAGITLGWFKTRRGSRLTPWATKSFPLCLIGNCTSKTFAAYYAPLFWNTIVASALAPNEGWVHSVWKTKQTHADKEDKSDCCSTCK